MNPTTLALILQISQDVVVMTPEIAAALQAIIAGLSGNAKVVPSATLSANAQTIANLLAEELSLQATINATPAQGSVK